MREQREGGGTVSGATAGASLADVVVGPERPGRVLATFPAAVHVLPDGHPRAIAVVGRGGVVLPNALVVEGRLPAEVVDAAVPAAPVTVGGGRLRVGRWTVQVDRWVDRRPRLDVPDRSEVLDRLGRLEAQLAAAPSLPEPLAVPTRDLAAAVVAGDPAAARAAADELVGLGQGLTPSGDDVLAGALASGRVFAAALDVPALDRFLHDLGGHVVARADGRTPALSAALLWHAARGEVAEPARHVLRALAGATPLDPAVRDLLRVGHSSGRDLAVGTALGVRAVLTAATTAPVLGRSASA